MSISNCYLKFLFFILLSLIISSCGNKIDGVSVSEKQKRGYLWLISDNDERSLKYLELMSVSDIPEDADLWKDSFFDAFPNISAVKYVVRNNLSQKLTEYYVYFNKELIVGVDVFSPRQRMEHSFDDSQYLRLILRKGW